jgi:hypothetical protein
MVHMKWIQWCGMLAIMLVIAPMAVLAQDYSRQPRWGHARGWPRGEIQVVNDWQDAVRISMWSSRRERIGDWIVNPGDQAVLEVDGERIKVRPGYKIKVGEDWGWVDVGEVGQFQQGTWYVSVRTIWRATHGERRGVPDWKG